jgi:rubrerythrin
MEFSELIDFAIAQEEKAAALYTRLAEKVKQSDAKEMLYKLRDFELEHKAMLLEYDYADFIGRNPQIVQDLKLTDFMMEPVENKDLSLQQVLILAAKNEKIARDMYLKMAEKLGDDPVGAEMFKILAEQEDGHKRIIEEELEDAFLKEM